MSSKMVAANVCIYCTNAVYALIPLLPHHHRILQNKIPVLDVALVEL